MVLKLVFHLALSLSDAHHAWSGRCFLKQRYSGKGRQHDEETQEIPNCLQLLHLFPLLQESEQLVPRLCRPVLPMTEHRKSTLSRSRTPSNLSVNLRKAEDLVQHTAVN